MTEHQHIDDSPGECRECGALTHHQPMPKGPYECVKHSVKFWRSQRTDDHFESGLDNKARIERVTTPELDVSRWVSDAYPEGEG